MTEQADEPIVRRAAPDDAGELTRLRVVMFESMGDDTSAVNERWYKLSIEHFRARLLDVESFAAFVIDKPNGGLAACAVGWLNPHLLGTRNESVRIGYVANMSTEAGYRRRGYGRATLSALLGWIRSAGVGRVDLHASPDGEALYRSLGFTDPEGPALILPFSPG